VEVSERAAAGKEARSRVPRSTQAEWEAAADRADPVELLERQATSRVQALLPVRYGRMSVSPFTFYRGAAAVMAADLAGTPISGLDVQMCGDAHLSNFGVFAAPDRRLVFDLNDFDETLPGPWEWDLKRLAASFEIAARDNGFKRRDRRQAVLTVTRTYRESMHEFAKMRNLEIWYARLDADEALESLRSERPKSLKQVERAAAKARAKDSVRALERLTETVAGELRIASRPPLLVPIEELAGEFGDFDIEKAINTVLIEYADSMKGDRRHLLSEYRYRHLAHKVVGVGSVGTRAWVVLLTGRDDGDPLFLQAKEAQASVFEPHVGSSRFRNHGRRVVEGQWLMQAASDSFLGWCAGVEADGEPRDYYVRQLWDQKGSGDIESMRPRAMEIYAQGCGWTLARAHARSGDPVAIGAYLGSGDAFDEAIADFSSAYADQNERDHAALLAAIDSGRLEAVDA
jgi:uncharacterized protein (DUF2252 family)